MYEGGGSRRPRFRSSCQRRGRLVALVQGFVAEPVVALVGRNVALVGGRVTLVGGDIGVVDAVVGVVGGGEARGLIDVALGGVGMLVAVGARDPGAVRVFGVVVAVVPVGVAAGVVGGLRAVELGRR